MVFLNTLVMSNTKCVPEEHTGWNRPLKSKRLHQGEESPSWSKNLSLSKKKKKKAMVGLYQMWGHWTIRDFEYQLIWYSEMEALLPFLVHSLPSMAERASVSSTGCLSFGKYSLNLEFFWVKPSEIGTYLEVLHNLMSVESVFTL